MIPTIDRPAVVAAGGIVPGVPDGPGADTVVARPYRHDVLDERVVVRLRPDALGEAEDLAMEYLGFACVGDGVPVGVAARQAVGFPAWALVHDPANGRHALAMVKEMEKLARTAKSKPGNAKDGYDAIAVRLGRAAPHFLPTFWEQAGRAFSAADSAAHAATCFTKARDAERVHALGIDEDRVADVYLEFALVGALPAKALTQYSRDLAARLPIEVALERTILLSTQRVAGGLAPHAGLVEDVARLAKRAGSDALARVLPELLATPAVAKANAGFWRSCRKDLIRLAGVDPRVRERLLGIVLDSPGWRTDLTDMWLDLLEATGSLDVLLDRPGNVQTTWLERMAERRTRSYNAQRSLPLLNLVERMAPALRAAGRPLSVIGMHGGRADVDLLDLLLACDVPVDTAPISRLHLPGWLADTNPGRRDLDALAASGSLREAMWPALRDLLATNAPFAGGTASRGNESRARMVLAVSGLRRVAHDRLESAAGSLGDATLAQITDLIDDIAPLCSGTGVAAGPQAATRLAGADVAAALTRTLQAGLINELGWPALDEAIARFDARAMLSFGQSWPHLVVTDGARAVVVTHDRIVLDVMLQVPLAATRHWDRPRMHYVDGVLFVSFIALGAHKAYWSNQPADVFPIDVVAHTAPHTDVLSMPVTGGGITTGIRALHVGDRFRPSVAAVACDGVTFWRLDSDDRNPGRFATNWFWREYDPMTGAPGRKSLPRFFEEAGESLEDRSCTLMPLPADLPMPSPLGAVGGLAGWRVSRTADGGKRGEGIDGRSADFCGGAEPAGLLDLPGADRPLQITQIHRWNAAPVVQVLDPDTGVVASRADMSHKIPPMPYWHFLKPRDPAGSAALRRLSAEDATTLLKIGGTTDGPVRATAAQLVDAVRAAMPAIGDPTLAAAIASQAQRAHDAATWLADVGALAADPTTVGDQEARTTVTESAISAIALGLHGYGPGRYWFTSSSRTGAAGSGTLGEIRAVGAALRGEDISTEEFTATVDWALMVGSEKALALRAASEAFSAEQRKAARATLTALADAGFLDLPGGLRILRLEQTLPDRSVNPAGVTRTGLSTLVRLRTMNYIFSPTSTVTAAVRAIDHAREGVFGPIDGATIAEDHRLTPAMSGEQVRNVTALVAVRGPASWRPEAVDALTERSSMTRGEAALVLAGMPDIMGQGANPYPAHLRERLGLSAVAARTARDSLRDLTPHQRVALLSAALPRRVDDLWTSGPDVDAVAACWSSLFGERDVLAEDLLAEATRVVPGKAVEIVRGVTNPARCAWLGPTQIVTDNRLEGITAALPWVAYRLPAGDPARARLPEAYDRVMAALKHASQAVDVGYGRQGMPASLAVEATDLSYGPFASYRIKTALLTGPGDPVLDLVAAYVEDSTLLRLYSTRLASLMAAIRAEDAGEPRWLQDPCVCVPDLVAAVCERCAVDTDAAAYYLQLLALPDPTDRNVRRWTSWSAAALAKARQQLVASGLVLEAKRERAGRSVFLPGGWSKQRSPRLPVEEWKVSMYGWTGHAPTTVPNRPVTDLFHMAWQRVTGGDTPALQQLKEAR